MEGKVNNAISDIIDDESISIEEVDKKSFTIG